MMLAPDACLHWSYCEWRFAEHRYQHFDPADPALQPHQLDFYTRISMLRRFGFSQRLPNLPNWVAERYQQHIAIYKQHVRRFVGTADLLRLTGQPQREGHGERWPAFQYRLPDGSQHLLAVFRLPGGESARTIFPVLLDPARRYTIIWLGQQREEASSGAMLMTQGITFSELPEEGSALLLLH
jgi:alpha-galactosidase